MIWDVSQAYGNTLDVSPSYAHGVARLIHGYKKKVYETMYSFIVQ